MTDPGQTHFSIEAEELARAKVRIAELEAEVERLRGLIGEWTCWVPGRGHIDPIKPRHGSCCCCGTCGQFHDDCVCEHNEIDAALAPAELEADVARLRGLLERWLVSAGGKEPGPILETEAALDPPATPTSPEDD